MNAQKRLLIVKASSDICAAEVEHIKTVAEMFGMVHWTYDLKCLPDFRAALAGKGCFDYLYLAAHANVDCFGEGDGSVHHDWELFGSELCSSQCLNGGAILLLACCRGGLRRVADRLFDSCPRIDYVCGPRWTVTGLDITTGFHVFIYNMVVRREQPSCAVERASRATGYDFFCYDRIEMEDSLPRTI